MRVCFSADDFGWLPEINDGIIAAHIKGVLRATSLMVNEPYTDQAVSLACRYPKLDVGVHLCVTQGSGNDSRTKPLTDCQTLVDPETRGGGYFYGIKYFNEETAAAIDPNEVYEEFNAQVLRAYEFGIALSHIDCHHHIHTRFPVFREALRRVAEKYNLPVRKFGNLFSDEGLLNYDCIAGFGNFKNLCNKIELKKNEGEETLVNVCCHPSNVGELLPKYTNMVRDRYSERDMLMSGQMVHFLEKYSIQITSFSEYFGV